MVGSFGFSLRGVLFGERVDGAADSLEGVVDFERSQFALLMLDEEFLHLREFGTQEHTVDVKRLLELLELLSVHALLVLLIGLQFFTRRMQSELLPGRDNLRFSRLSREILRVRALNVMIQNVGEHFFILLSFA